MGKTSFDIKDPQTLLGLVLGLIIGILMGFVGLIAFIIVVLIYYLVTKKDINPYFCNRLITSF